MYANLHNSLMISNPEVLSARPFRTSLGQVDQGEGAVNRLLDLPTQLLIDRVQLAVGDRFGVFPQAALDLYTKSDLASVVWPPPGDYTDDQIALLRQVAANPTPEELRDLATIDTALLGQLQRADSQALCSGQPQPYPMFFMPPLYSEIYAFYPELRNDPFFCPPGVVGFPAGIPNGSAVSHHDTRHYLQFGNLSQPWRDLQMKTRNAYILFKALKGYPFPNPIPVIRAAWYANHDVHALLVELTEFPLPRNDNSAITFVQMMVTLVTVETLHAVAEVIADELKSEMEHELRRNIVRQAAIAVGIAILTAGIGAALTLVVPSVTLPGGLTVTATTAVEALSSAVQTYMTKEQQAKAAEELEKIATMFRPNNPAFAGEVQKVADTFKYLAGALGGAVQLTQDELDAIEEAKRQRGITPETHGVHDTPVHELQRVSPIVPIGVGVLAVGSLYFLLG